MKIVILVRILWSAGAQKIAINEAIELKRQGHDVDLIFLRREKTWKVYEDLLLKINYRVISEGKSSIFSGFYSFITGLFLPDRKGEGRIDYDLLKKFPKFIEILPKSLHSSIPRKLECIMSIKTNKHKSYGHCADYKSLRIPWSLCPNRTEHSAIDTHVVRNLCEL